MTKQKIKRIVVEYEDGSMKQIRKGMVCDVSTDDALAEFVDCDTETDIKPLLNAMTNTLKQFK